jgi:cell division protein FtsB
VYATGLDYGAITPMLLQAIKEQQRQIEELKAQVEELRKKIN